MNPMSSKTPIGNRSTNQTETIFDLIDTPTRVHIGPHSFAYAVVSFTPSSIATYTCQFEASLDNTPAMNAVAKRNTSVGFELCGEGTLPRFSILKPSVRNQRGQTHMMFKRTCVGSEDSQLLVLANDGTLAAKLNFSLIGDKGQEAFRIRPFSSHGKQERLEGIVLKENSVDTGTGPSIASVIIQPGAQAVFEVHNFILYNHIYLNYPL